VQTLVILDLVNAERFSVGRRSRSNQPATPRSRPADAGLTVVDLKRSENISNKWIARAPAGFPVDCTGTHDL
jgi:hypothetical protein